MEVAKWLKPSVTRVTTSTRYTSTGRPVEANTKLDPLGRRNSGVALGHASLHIDGAAHRMDHAGELQQQTIAGPLDDPAWRP